MQANLEVPDQIISKRPNVFAIAPGGNKVKKYSLEAFRAMPDEKHGLREVPTAAPQAPALVQANMATAATANAEPAKKTRTRRTKEQIAAEKSATLATNATAPIIASTTAATGDQAATLATAADETPVTGPVAGDVNATD